MDLKGINEGFQIEAFKMESLQSILLAINLGDWMLSVDLTPIYMCLYTMHFKNICDFQSIIDIFNSSAFHSASPLLPELLQRLFFQ